MEQKTSKFPIGSYAIVTNEKLQTYGMVGQVVDPKEFGGYCGRKSVCVRFDHWFDGRKKNL